MRKKKNLYTGDTVRAKTDTLYFRVLNNGDTMCIVTSKDGRVINPKESDYAWSSTIVGDSYSPSVAVHLEYNKVAHLTVSGVMTFALYLLVFLLVQLAASIVLAIVRRKKAAGRNIPFTAVWHGANVFLFTFCEVSVWYFLSAYPLLKVIRKGTGFGIGLVFLGPVFKMILGFDDSRYMGRSKA